MVGQELWRSGHVSATPSPSPKACMAITHSCLSWCRSNLMAASSHISTAQVTSDNLEGDLGTRVGNTPEINPTDANVSKKEKTLPSICFKVGGFPAGVQPGPRVRFQPCNLRTLMRKAVQRRSESRKPRSCWFRGTTLKTDRGKPGLPWAIRDRGSHN